MNQRTLLLLVSLGLFSLVILSPVNAQAALEVNVMPSGFYAWPGKTITIWGNVHDGAAPYTYTWNFGDGAPPVSGAVANPKYIAVTHSYATMGPKIASLTVTDNLGATNSDQVVISVWDENDPIIKPKNNLAIENGLRYLYLNQAADGSWPGGGGYLVSSTGLAVLAFENSGHRPVASLIKDDIYVECVQKGLQYVLNHGYTKPIGPQAHGDPDTDGDGKGIYFTSVPGANHESYETGIIMMAIVGVGDDTTGAPDSVVSSTSSPDINGHTLAEVLRDAVDWCAWAQTDDGTGRGGWRYYGNYGNSDNSVSQWPAIGLEAAETGWGISAPAFVKSELTFWINYSQNVNGCFGYTNPNEWVNLAKTGAGLCLMAYAGIPTSDPRVIKALECICANWNSTAWDYGNFGDLYAMYGVTKGCRSSLPPITYICPQHKWAEEYDSCLVVDQLGDGSWSASRTPRLDVVMATEFAVLILNPGIVDLPPVAMINAPDEVPPDTPFPMDARGSKHRDPARRIVEWLWDFDASDGVDWNNPDAVGLDVVNPGYSLGALPSATFKVTLRVADDRDSAWTDTDEHIITVNIGNHPPVADAGGPYSGKINQIITFDGTGSFDLDPGDYVATYSWDLDGDGNFGDCTDPVCTRTWDHVYSGRVGLKVWDSHGAVSHAESYVNVWTSLYDAWLSDSDIKFNPECVTEGTPVQISAAIHCDAASDKIRNLTVRFYDGDPDVAEKQIGADQVIDSLMAGNSYLVYVDWVVPDKNAHEIYVRIDPKGEIEEFNEDNNEAHKTLWCPYINACVDIDPNTLNLKSQGKWITCRIEFCDPRGYDVADIVLSSVKLNGIVPAELWPSTIGDYDSDGIPDRMVKFSREAAQGVVIPGNHVAMTVTGMVGSHQFKGTDYIVVINPPIAPEDGVTTVDVVSLDTYPNPFNPTVQIVYGVPSPSRVLVQIWSVSGRLVRTVEDVQRSMGIYVSEWNGKDDAGRDVSSGVYICKLSVGKDVLLKKLTLLK